LASIAEPRDASESSLRLGVSALKILSVAQPRETAQNRRRLLQSPRFCGNGFSRFASGDYGQLFV
jgi:hypothetical protein